MDKVTETLIHDAESLTAGEGGENYPDSWTRDDLYTRSCWALGEDGRVSCQAELKDIHTHTQR